MPATFGAITHSAPSMKHDWNHSTASHGRTPSSSMMLPSTISRWMWCAYAVSRTSSTHDRRQLASVRAVQNTSGNGMSAPSASSSRHRSEEHTSELQSRQYLVCRLLLEKKKVAVSVPD